MTFEKMPCGRIACLFLVSIFSTGCIEYGKQTSLTNVSEAFLLANLSDEFVTEVMLMEELDFRDDSLFLVFKIPKNRLDETLSRSRLSGIEPTVRAYGKGWQGEIGILEILDSPIWDSWRNGNGADFWDITTNTHRINFLTQEDDEELLCFYANLEL